MLTFDRQKVLGKGGFATVYEGVWGKSKTKVAVKRIVVGDAATNEQEEMALKMLDHPNVIKLFHVEEDQDFKYFALELCDASLEKLFLKEDDPNKYRGPMPPETEVLLQLAKGLEHIHQKGLVHRDIKPQNVLIRSDSTTQQVVMKWADFGLSKQVNERGTFTMSGVKGTLDYFAPEILKLLDEDQIANDNEKKDIKYDKKKKRGTVKSDVFAEGLVFGYFLLGGVHPFGNTSHEIQTNLRTNKPANLPKTGKIFYIIKKMLDEPDYRTTSLLVVNRLKELKNSQEIFTLLAEGNPSVEEIEKLIQDGANVNATDEKGLTPLLRLTKSKKISGRSMSEIADLLIQHGANVHLRDRKGRNALVLSCENCEQHGDMGIIYLLIKNGIDIHCRNEDGDNALMLLCRYYSHNNLSSLVDFFIDNGIDFNCKNRYGDNALTLLCRYYNHENLLRVIRRTSWKTVININCKNKYGDNALTLLCQYYNQENLIDVITFLIERLFKVTKETRDYFHMFYSKNNRDEVLQLLHV